MTSTSFAIAHIAAILFFLVCYNGASNFKDVGDALGFYGVYHQDPINQLIHFFGVPIIIWSLHLFLAHIKLPFIDLPLKGLPCIPSHDMTYATLTSIGYVLFYLKLDWFGG